MRIVIFNWRDLGHPKSGGAEISTHILAKGLARRGHDVQWFTSRSPLESDIAERDGYHIIRRGTELTCRLHAVHWLLTSGGNIDVIIDEVNTLPFLTPFFLRDRVVLWMHQLAREVWLSEAPFPIGALGYVAEPLMLRLYAGVPIVTVSASSAASIAKLTGASHVEVVENALLPGVGPSDCIVPGRIGYVGRLTPSKRVEHIIEAVAILRAKAPEAHLVIVGRGSPSYVAKLRRHAHTLGVLTAVEFRGRTDDHERDALFRSFDVLAMASMREGWGLVVSEAARYAVPAVVYPVPGLIDSVRHAETGVVVEDATPQHLACGIADVMTNRILRATLGKKALRYIDGFTEERFIERFEALLVRHARRTRTRA